MQHLMPGLVDFFSSVTTPPVSRNRSEEKKIYLFNVWCNVFIYNLSSLIRVHVRPLRFPPYGVLRRPRTKIAVVTCSQFLSKHYLFLHESRYLSVPVLYAIQFKFHNEQYFHTLRKCVNRSNNFIGCEYT